jgi:hemoglobin/transferrin/lactoferrin receptor protein
MTKNLLLTAAFALLFSFQSLGQDVWQMDEPVETVLSKASPDSLDQEPIPLGEVEISSMRVNRRMKDVPQPMAVVGAGNFLKLSSQTLSNVLGAEPGISMGRDGAWSTTISIRGLSENRLVTLIDGHRVETATDLTASFSMLDVNDIERVEVIKGAQSSLYGTGAMGGIVNIITKEGHFAAKPYVSGNATLGYGGVNNLLTEHAGVNTGAKKWTLRLSGTHTAADDLRTPEGTIPNSQFTLNNVTAKAGLKPWENHVFRVQYQNNWSTDVGIPGGSAFPGPATATYTEISRHLFSASYEITAISRLLSSVKANYFTQYIQRDVEMIPNTVTETKIPAGTQRVTPELVVPIGNHLTHGGQFQTTWTPGDKNTLIAGVDIWSRTMRTDRTKYIKNEVINPAGNIVKTINLVRGETPIPKSSFSSGGIFVQDEARLFNDRLTLITGGRVDGIVVENKEGTDIDYLIIDGVRNDTPPNQRITFPAGKNNTLSWSANAGLLYKATKETDLTLNLARSFRAPSLEELFKYIDLGNYVSLGDPELKPENGASADVGIRIWKPRFNLQVNGFVNRIGNLVVETPGEFIYTINTGPLEGTQDTLPALIYDNVSKALLYGADFGMQYNVWPNVVVVASGSYVRGKDPGSETDLPRIPPLNGRVGLRYTLPKYGSAELTMVSAARQEKIAAGEKATGGFTRFDLALSSARIHLGETRLQLFAGVDNLTGQSYTNHLATNRGGISVEPGRNIYLRLNLAF